MVEYQSPYTIVGPVPKWNYFFQPVIPLFMQPETKLDVCIWQNGLTQEKESEREREHGKSTVIGKGTAPDWVSEKQY